MTTDAPTRTPRCTCTHPRVLHVLRRTDTGYGGCSRCECTEYQEAV